MNLKENNYKKWAETWRIQFTYSMNEELYSLPMMGLVGP